MKTLSMDFDLGNFAAAVPTSPRMYLGHELVGEVIKAGSEADDIMLGDRVAVPIRQRHAVRERRPAVRAPPRHGRRFLPVHGHASQPDLPDPSRADRRGGRPPGADCVHGMVTHRFALDEYRRAIGAFCSKGKSRAIKIVIEHEAVLQ